MKVVTVAATSPGLDDLIEQARKENIILRAVDGTEFLLAEIDDFDREIGLTRKNRDLMTYLEERARQQQTTTLGAARRELGLS